MTPDTQTIAPVVRAMEVPLPPDDAVRLFTEDIDSWWPKATHSVAEEHAARITFEPGEGGRIFETTDDGVEHEWGRVTAWAPPGSIVFSWYPSRGPDTQTEIELRFTRAGDGTRVELEHRGWEALGEKAADQATAYATGWEVVLGRYVAAA